MTTETRQQVQYLLARYIDAKATPQEEALLFELVNKEESSADWEEMLEELILLEEADSNYSRERWQPVLETIVKHKEPAKQKISQIMGWRIAASIVLVLGVAAWFLFNKADHDQQTIVQQPVKFAPGKDGAILTLSDGSKVVLDSMGNGVIATQSGTTIELQQGRLTYQQTGKEAGKVLYNTMTTPRGRQFQLSLPDGSKVWLNAESSVTYPVAFTGKERKVTMTGEAYFEVSPLPTSPGGGGEKSGKMPFIVVLPPTGGGGGSLVEVLGTHFNINAYNNEPAIATTLLEGSVKFTHEKQQSMLKPGQQGKLSTAGNITVVNDADIDKIMAWKNGAFNFEGASLEEVMRQLERWYNIKVVYEKDIPKKEFVGEIGRNITLDELLKGLKGTGVHFRIEGRTLVVLP
jgi:transmembrane sensor